MKKDNRPTQSERSVFSTILSTFIFLCLASAAVATFLILINR